MPFLDPEFEGLFFLKSANEDGGSPSEALFLEGLFEMWGHLGFDGGEALGSAGVVVDGEVESLGIS